MSQLLLPADVLGNTRIESVHQIVKGKPPDRGPLQLLGIGHQLKESEAPSQRRIKQPDAPVRRVHRRKYVKVWWNDE